MYGAKNNKTLKLFIEDLHLPARDICEEQSANELLRQVLDTGILYSSTKPHKQKVIEGMLVLSTINPAATERSDRMKYARLVVSYVIVF